MCGARFGIVARPRPSSADVATKFPTTPVSAPLLGDPRSDLLEGPERPPPPLPRAPRGSIPQQLNLVNLREGCVPPDDCREVAERGHETTSAWYKRFNKWLVGVLGVVIAALLEAFRACGSRLM